MSTKLTEQESEKRKVEQNVTDMLIHSMGEFKKLKR